MRIPLSASLSACILALLGGALPAQAAGLSSDLELLRPHLATDAPLGMPGLWQGPVGAAAVGFNAWYSRRPLVLHDTEEGDRVLIGDRESAALLGGARFTRALSGQVSLPLARQGGGTGQELTAKGLAVGDATVGFQGLLPTGRGPFGLGVGGGLRVPIGTREAWSGEGISRVDLDLMARLGLTSFGANVDLGLTFPLGKASSEEGLSHNEERASLGAWYALLPRHLDATVALLSRFLGKAPWVEGEPPPLEGLVGLRARVGPRWSFDLAGGAGLTRGFGTTAGRALLGISWVGPAPRADPSPEELEPLVREDLKDRPVAAAVKASLPPAALPEASSPTDPAPTVRAWREEDRIQTDGRILFDHGTARLRPDSLDTIASVAGVINTDASIGLLMIEGHASEEGDLVANFSLSLARAQAVFEALVQSGVDPDRLGVRAKGEVEPLKGEDALVRSRRVELHILPALPGAAPQPAMTREIRLPWTGEPQWVEIPGVAGPPPPPANPSVQSYDFLDEEEEEP